MKRLGVLSLAYLALLLANPASAADDSERRVVVLTTDADLAERVRGQLSDLPFEIVFLAESASTDASVDSESSARRLAAEHGAAVVVWFEPLPGQGWKMSAADVEHGDLLVRRVVVPDPSDRLAASAAAEAAALVARSTLMSVASGARLGDDASRAEQREASDAARPSSDALGAASPPPTPPAEPRPDLARSEPPAERPRRWLFVELGADAGVDTSDAAPWVGFSGALGARVDAWELGASGDYAVPRELSDSFTRLRLERYGLDVRIGRSLWHTEQVELLAVGRAGAVLYERHTDALASNVTATEDGRQVTPAIAIGAALRWAPRGVPLAFTLRAGAQALMLPPEFAYAEGSESVVRTQIWPVQPELQLSVQLRSGGF